MTFKNGVSEFMYAKTEYPTEEAAIEAEKSVKNNAGDGLDYVSHTRNGKVVDVKYQVSGMTKEEGLITLDLMAKGLEDPQGVFDDLLGEMDGFEFDF